MRALVRFALAAGLLAPGLAASQQEAGARALCAEIESLVDAVRGGELWLSDTDQMRDRVAYVVPAAVAKSLQRRVRAKEITLDEMYAEILKNMTRGTLPAE